MLKLEGKDQNGNFTLTLLGEKNKIKFKFELYWKLLTITHLFNSIK